jgi:hypothetical protein
MHEVHYCNSCYSLSLKAHHYPVCLSYKYTFSANEQYFSLITNQQTIILTLTFQLSEQVRDNNGAAGVYLDKTTIMQVRNLPITHTQH